MPNVFGFDVTGSGFWEQAWRMRWRLFIWAVVGLAFVAWGMRTEAAPNQLVPQGLGKTEKIPGLLSYKPPAGWEIVETGGDSQARGPISNGVVPDITMSPGNNGSLAKLSDTFEPEYYDTSASLKIVQQTSFVTAAGVKGVCARCVDPSGKLPITQYSYIFLSPDGQELELACACATVDAAVYKPVFDASMKTVIIAKGD